MIERRQDLRFTFESRQPFRIRGKRVWQDLQRNVPLQACVACVVDLAHPARAEGRDDFIGAEANPRFEPHRDFSSSGVPYLSSLQASTSEPKYSMHAAR